VPFAVYFPGIQPDGVNTFDEIACAKGAYGLMHGDEFMNMFMNLK
jgi:2,3-bisphosphoglycerate-independent phosphoglycerate mutase